MCYIFSYFLYSFSFAIPFLIQQLNTRVICSKIQLFHNFNFRPSKSFCLAKNFFTFVSSIMLVTLQKQFLSQRCLNCDLLNITDSNKSLSLIISISLSGSTLIYRLQEFCIIQQNKFYGIFSGSVNSCIDKRQNLFI